MVDLLLEAQKCGLFPKYVAKLLSAFELPIKAVNFSPDQQWIGSEIESLSERELEALRLLADGASNREIAQQLTVSLGTVKKHLNNIYVKLDAASRTQAVAAAQKYNILSSS